MIYLEKNVFEEGLDRIRFLYDTHDDIIVGMSGGKDSTVLFNMTMMIAKEKNRLPLKCFWLDQEAEWQETVDYMDWVMRLPDVKPYWFQVPMDFPNCLSNKDCRLLCWDPSQKSKWIHPQSDIAITENPMGNRLDYTFYDLIGNLKNYCTDGNCAVLTGMRIAESPMRRYTIASGKPTFQGITWANKKDDKDKYQVFYPIYDFTFSDIWTAIGRNHWKYNTVYDKQYQKGVASTQMRVSALIHETACYAMDRLQEFEPKNYNRLVDRIAGSSAITHAFDYSSVLPKELPFMFRDWKEYRDFLLVNIVNPEYQDFFRKRWRNQNDEEWYKVHVKECILNDLDGTLNATHRKMLQKAEANARGGKRDKMLKAELEEYLNDKRPADK